MYNIAICEDNDQCLENLRACLGRFFEQANGGCRLSKYSRGDMFLRDLKPHAYDIVFFDVEMPGADGISVAKKLREVDKRVIIIFTTAHSQPVFSSFAAEPLQYLLKPLNYDSFESVMNLAVQKIEKDRRDCIILSFNNSIYKIPLREIVYFESRERTLLVHLTDREYTFYAKLNEIESRLENKDFIRSHQSYLVNMSFIRKIDKSNMLLSTGRRLDISRSKLKATKDLFMSYLMDLMP